uniref:DOMON domain-containing protein n=1 Tax=Davidia involucrata TaxID=16924 RepID=A0A5B7C6T1_DAVIN
MAKMPRPVLFSCVVISLFLSSSAQSCAKYAFASNKVFSACNDLPYLNSFLHWTYEPSSGKAQIAYRHTGITSSEWVAWAINPKSKGMVGAQALVAFQQSDGKMKAYTSPVTSYRTQLQEGDLDFMVSDLSATSSNKEIIIFATLKLPSNTTTVNQVWQYGPLSGTAPGPGPGVHDLSGPNVESMGTLNLLSGQSETTTAGGGNTKTKKRNVCN